MDSGPLLIFIIVVILNVITVFKEMTFKIPRLGWNLTIDYAYPPILGVILLLASARLSVSEVITGGLIGDEHIQPFAIIIIFISLSYICIAIDMTGVLAYFALKVSSAAGGSQASTLFAYIFLLSCVFTTFTSTDIVILTLTPIITYCSYATRLNPFPFLYAQFFAATTCSLLFLIGNPTNIIVGQAAGLTFGEYAKWMCLPALGTVSTACFVLAFHYRKELKVVFSMPSLDANAVLVDRTGAIVSLAILIITICFLTVAPWFHADLWVICLVGSIITFLFNVYSWKWANNESVTTEVEIEMKSRTSLDSPTPSKSLEPIEVGVHSDSAASATEPTGPPTSPSQKSLIIGDSPKSSDDEAPGTESIYQSAVVPTIRAALIAVPWRIIPFMFGMFVVVEGLNKTGWIDTFADLFISAIPTHSETAGIFAATFLFLFVTVLISNMINNQPATILLTRVLISDPFLQVPDKVRWASIYAVIAAANLSVNFTIIGGLGGMMFAKILKQKDIPLSFPSYFKMGVRVHFFTLVICGILIAIQHL